MNSPAHAAEVPNIAPFWTRLPQFFLYPLHVEPLLYSLLLSAATVVGMVLPLPLAFFLVQLGIWLAFIRYAYKVLDQTAQGRLHPDQYSLCHDPERNSLPYKQFAVFLVFGMLNGLALAVGKLLYGIVLIFTTLVTPASVMILALSRSFRSAINPAAQIGMMRAIGWPYLGLCAFLFLLFASMETMQILLLERLSPYLLLPLLTLVAMYFMLIMFNMMGYVIYQYHHLLGVKIDDNKAARPGKRAFAQSADELGQLIAEGRMEEALDSAYEAQRVAPDDIGAQQRYHKLLGLAGKEERQLQHAGRYLGLLLQKNEGAEALKLYQAMQARDAAFAPEQPGQLLLLARAARQLREYNQALTLIKGFDKRFPRHVDIPAVYLFAAQVLCENLKQDAPARQILKVLLQRYPEHPVSVEAQQLLTVLDRLAATPA